MSTATPARVTVREVRLSERDVRFRLPFRFGVVTLTGSPQVFVHARVALADGRETWGMAAEMLAAKWFDKNTALSNEQNYEQLRASLRLARDAYLAGGQNSAFGHFSSHYAGQIAQRAKLGLNSLLACYGPALIDRALLDALCRALGISFYEAVRRNVPGMSIPGLDMPKFLSGLEPGSHIAARHTVGLVDPITAADLKARVNDGLPETLEEVVARYGQRYFKLKVGGDIAADVERLSAIAAVLDGTPEPYHASLDGNEQYDDVDGVRVKTKDGWWLLRASNTQAVLVARAEAGDEAGLERLKAHLGKQLEQSGVALPDKSTAGH